MPLALLYIGAEDVRRILKPGELILPLEEVLAQFSRQTTEQDETEQVKKEAIGGGAGGRGGGVLQPVRTVLNIQQHQGLVTYC